MAMIIKIEIQGLALCYRQGSYWQVVFICDNWHPVNFTHTREREGARTVITSRKPLRTNGRDRHIIFDADGAAAPASPFGGGFSKILNIAGPHLHGTDANGKANVNRKRNGEREMIFMLIPAAALDTLLMTPETYYVAEDVPSPSKREIGQIAKIIGAEITLNEGAGGAMILNDGTDSANFPYQDGDIHTLNFDNDCGSNCGEIDNDFRLFYDWIEDVDGKKRFIAGKVSPDPTAIEGTFSSDQGNCDPGSIDPPPGP
jgi:hypothetical protein